MMIRKEELAFNGPEDKENNEILLGKCSTMLLIVVGWKISTPVFFPSAIYMEIIFAKTIL